MDLPELSVFRARSTFAIGAMVGLLVMTGYLSPGEAAETEALFMGYAADTWDSVASIAAVGCGVWAWFERRNPRRKLTLTGGGSGVNSHWVTGVVVGCVLLLSGCLVADGVASADRALSRLDREIVELCADLDDPVNAAKIDALAMVSESTSGIENIRDRRSRYCEAFGNE